MLLAFLAGVVVGMLALSLLVLWLECDAPPLEMATTVARLEVVVTELEDLTRVMEEATRGTASDLAVARCG